MSKQYVLGFAFDYKRENVVLIEKQHPEWQKDKFNGVGGKVEPGDENIHAAMVREFFEETGVVTDQNDWFYYTTMDFSDDVMGGGAQVFVFRSHNINISQCSTCTDELVEICPLETVYQKPLMHNLHLLIPLALQNEFGFASLKQEAKVKEPVKPNLSLKLIQDELQRQEDKYGYTDKYIADMPEDYGKGELAIAAASYLLSDTWLSKDHGHIPDIIFPWDDMYFKPSPDDRIKELVKAGAMIVREINRLNNKS